LLAGDEEEILYSLKKVLISRGYSVFVAIDGFTAVQIVERKLIDVAILDFRISSIASVKVLKEIKSIDNKIEVLIISGFPDLNDFSDAILAVGLYDYLIRPFGIDELLLRIRQAVQKRQKYGQHSSES